ncbi:hypothetical protein K661_01302 [Piscirickettsia salmonis LF-89 = ATCC VR-1361]|nr:hypothetical protein K661_01302 [Piscirickettsia salmonis LF-89 = ATCC VR-1361]
MARHVGLARQVFLYAQKLIARLYTSYFLGLVFEREQCEKQRTEPLATEKRQNQDIFVVFFACS